MVVGIGDGGKDEVLRGGGGSGGIDKSQQETWQPLPGCSDRFWQAACMFSSSFPSQPEPKPLH